MISEMFDQNSQMKIGGLVASLSLLLMASEAGAMTLDWTLRDDGGRVLRELETSFPDGVEDWGWRRDYIRTPGGRAVAISERDGSQVANLVIHSDHLGSPRVISRGSTVVGRATYFPYGESAETGKSSNIGFTGHEKDEETGLYNMGARIYNPRLGRFLTPDPVANDQWNRYSYVANNPLSLVDPTGRQMARPSNEVLAQLASCVYDDGCDRVGGFARVESFDYDYSDFQAALFHDPENDSYVLAFRGTDPNRQDVLTDLAQGLGLDTQQYSWATWLGSTMLRELREKTERTVPNLTFTGHSLGGGLAATASIATGLKATTFNAAGVHPETVRRDGFRNGWNYSAAITNYVVPFEILTFSQNNNINFSSRAAPDSIGRQVVLPAQNLGTNNPIARHSMSVVCRALQVEC